MKRAVGYGLALLAALLVAAGSARASSADGAAAAVDGAAQFYVGGSGAAHGAQGYLGVSVRDVTADQVSVLKLKEARGAEVVLVDHDAPAGKAGLREHDVVLQINGQTIDGKDQLGRTIHECVPGKAITLLISRDGQQMTVSTQLSTQEEVERQAWAAHITEPEPQAPSQDSVDSGISTGAASSSSPRAGNSFIGGLLMNPSYTGAMLEKMSTQLAGYFGVSSGAGLLVRSVVANSPAAAAGMRAGDVVVRANQQAVTSTNDWAKAIKNSHGQPLTVVVLRDKKEQTLTLTPDGKKRSELEQPFENANRILLAHLGMSWMPRY